MKRLVMTLAALLCAAAMTLHAPAARADACHLSWDIPCCPIPGTNFGVADVVLTICNCTDIKSNYRFTMKTTAQDVTFVPSEGSVVLQPGECVDIPISVICGPEAPGGFVFQANVLNTNTGNQFSCTGSIRPAGSDWKVTPTNPAPPIVVGEPTIISFVATNMGMSPSLSVQIQTMGNVEVMSDPTPRIDVMPGQTMVFFVEIMAHPPDPILTRMPHFRDFYDVILHFDNGEGMVMPNSSVGGAITPADSCPADLTGDGAVGSADLAELLGNWGLCPL